MTESQEIQRGHAAQAVQAESERDSTHQSQYMDQWLIGWAMLAAAVSVGILGVVSWMSRRKR